MSMNNLTVDGEFRYIIQWFNEWSELQRDDFVPILLDYLTRDTRGVYVNGVVSGMANAEMIDKPMSLFQCRVKLFREWSPKWPEEMKNKLKEKIMELDPRIADKIIKELNLVTGGEVTTNGTNGTTEEATIACDVNGTNENGAPHIDSQSDSEVVEYPTPSAPVANEQVVPVA